jgi:hypothetical protein
MRLRSKLWCGSADEGQADSQRNKLIHSSCRDLSLALIQAAPMTRMKSELDLFRQPLPAIRSDPNLPPDIHLSSCEPILG